MATALAMLEGREVVRCDACELVQFVTSSLVCRRCRASLENEAPATAVTEIVVPIASPAPWMHCRQPDIGFAVWLLRWLRAMTQDELAMRLNSPRTYISKIECNKVVPTLTNLQRLAAVLDVSTSALVAIAAARAYTPEARN